MLSLARRAQDPEHLLHESLVSLSCEHQGQLKFVTPICACNTGIAERSCSIKQQCSKMSRLQMEHGGTKKHFLVPIADLNSAPLEMFFSTPACVRLNCLRISVRLFRLKMHKYGVAPTLVCECGTKKEQLST